MLTYNVRTEIIPAMHTPPHHYKASTNQNVSKPLMVLYLALNAFILTICDRPPTYRYFIKPCIFWAAANLQPTIWRGRVKDSIVFFFLSRESLENKPSMQSCCPRLHNFASSARFFCPSTTHTHTVYTKSQNLEYMNSHKHKYTNTCV